jgi:DNA-binding NarL/FixJ family response regulator
MEFSSKGPPTPLRLLIVDDHEFTRAGLTYSLQQREGIVIVGESENGEEAIRAVNDLKPDAVLMDIVMPVMDGIAATQAIKSDHPDIKVVMLTAIDSIDEIHAALSAGADAYCMKDIHPGQLLQVFNVIFEGTIWLAPSIARKVLIALSEKPEVPASSNTTGELRPRELEVLKLISQGRSNKEIAQELNISVPTVKANVSSLIQKLSVSDRTQAAIKAIQDGLV